MRILIYSDVHGNLPAFEAVIKHAGNCDAYVCLGDLVNYGPWSNECVDLALSLPNFKIIAGNHEEDFIKGSYSGTNELVKQFFTQCIHDFDRIEQIKHFIQEYRVGEYLCKHTIFNKYIFPDTNVVLDDNYIIGHSHHQFAYNNNGFALYNCGSVGQNRKIIDVANYIIYDTLTGINSLHSVVYPFDKLIAEMKQRKYPAECIAYYLGKKTASYE